MRKHEFRCWQAISFVRLLSLFETVNAHPQRSSTHASIKSYFTFTGAMRVSKLLFNWYIRKPRVPFLLSKYNQMSLSPSTRHLVHFNNSSVPVAKLWPHRSLLAALKALGHDGETCPAVKRRQQEQHWGAEEAWCTSSDSRNPAAMLLGVVLGF